MSDQVTLFTMTVLAMDGENVTLQIRIYGSQDSQLFVRTVKLGDSVIAEYPASGEVNLYTESESAG